MQAIAQRHIDKPFFQQAKTGGQRQRIAKLHKIIVIIIYHIFRLYANS